MGQLHQLKNLREEEIYADIKHKNYWDVLPKEQKSSSGFEIPYSRSTYGLEKFV